MQTSVKNEGCPEAGRGWERPSWTTSRTADRSTTKWPFIWPSVIRVADAHDSQAGIARPGETKRAVVSGRCPLMNGLM
jgi:hypothetical protein